MSKQTTMTKRFPHCVGWGGVGVLFAALLSIAVVHAQVGPPATAPVVGRAPVVTIEVVNETSPGAPAASGHQLRANATVTDPDDDTITATTYRWLRGTTQVGTSATYTTVDADVGQTLSVEATATTDPARTNPASGKSTATVAVGANTAPVATNVRIEGVLAVGNTVQWAYDYSDADGDLEGATVYVWCRRGVTCGLSTARSYTIQEADFGYHLNGNVTPKSDTGSPDTGAKVDFNTPTTNEWRVTRTTATPVQTAQVLPVGQASASFSPLTSVGGGVAPYSYEIVSGTLPVGLVLDAATGAVTGTPTTVQAAENVVFRVKDANNVAATNTSTVSYLVGLPTVTISPFDADPIYVGQAINLTGSYTFIANGGPPEQGSTYQWYLGKASDGSDKVAIDGATQRTLSYTIQPMDQNRHLFFEVTPRNAVFTGQKVTTATQRIVFGSTTVAGNGTITITVTGITPTAVPHFTFMGVAPCRVRVKLPGASTTFGNANVWRTAGPQINPNIWFTLEPEGCAATEFRLYFATP